jgi:hypothetical protein
LIGQFIDKLLSEWQEQRVSQAVVLTNSATDTSWFHALLEVASGVCLTRGRVNFYSPIHAGNSPRQGQAFFYLRDISHRAKRGQLDPLTVFKQRFDEFGTIVEASL